MISFQTSYTVVTLASLGFITWADSISVYIFMKKLSSEAILHGSHYKIKMMQFKLFDLDALKIAHWFRFENNNVKVEMIQRLPRAQFMAAEFKA
jgi:hypothetical protein